MAARLIQNDDYFFSHLTSLRLALKDDDVTESAIARRLFTPPDTWTITTTTSQRSLRTLAATDDHVVARSRQGSLERRTHKRPHSKHHRTP